MHINAVLHEPGSFSGTCVSVVEAKVAFLALACNECIVIIVFACFMHRLVVVGQNSHKLGKRTDTATEHPKQAPPSDVIVLLPGWPS